MFSENDIKSFTEALASKSSVPGGGGASALVGAVGSSLGLMVGSLTLGKKKYADVEGDVIVAMEKAEALRVRLVQLIDEDAVVFEPLSKAYGIPKDDPTRDSVMEDALKLACTVPVEIMRVCCRAIDLMKEFADKGSMLAISDAGVGAACCKAALMGASLNVYINTKSMKNREYAASIEHEADSMLNEYCAKADAVYNNVVSRLR